MGRFHAADAEGPQEKIALISIYALSSAGGESDSPAGENPKSVALRTSFHTSDKAPKILQE